MKYSRETQREIDTLWHEIGLVKNDRLRTNMGYTFDKLLVLLDTEFENHKGFLEAYIEMDTKGEYKGPEIPQAGRYGN